MARTHSMDSGAAISPARRRSLEEGAADYRESAAHIIALHHDAEKHRDSAIASTHFAIAKAMAVGEALLAAREKYHGNFEEWFKNYIESQAETFSRRTAYNYMRVVRHKDALDSPDFATLKDAYQAAGILPPHDSGESPAGSRPAPLFRVKMDLNGPPPEEWPSLERRDFLEKTRPIMELRERVLAAESA